MSYLGNSPGVASQRVITSKTATEGQIRISTNSGYVKGYVDVIINGIDMVSGVDFTEVGDGINVDMVVPLTSGDTIKLVSWIPRGLTDGYLKSESDALMTQTLGLSSFRNRIINGDMKISQRGTSFAAASGYTVDRFNLSKNNTAVITITQNTDVPTGSGFSNSLRATVTTADTSIVAGDYSLLLHTIEGYNVADLVGTPFTISFWVRSSKTGKHCLSLRSSTGDRTYVSEYVINLDNTWEKKIITVQSGLDISAGSWNFTNGRGLEVGWSMAIGSSLQTATPNSWVASNALATANQVNCLDTVGNIFAITGVQLERGSSATNFEFRPVDVELRMCQRYFSRFFMVVETGGLHQSLTLPNMMRVAPTISNDVGANFSINNVNLVTMSIYEGARVGRTISVSAEL